MHAKFETKAKLLGRADEDEAHALRIKAKKLRYVLELIELYPGWTTAGSGRN
jgi:CHAD domain-containing protein